MNRQHKFANQMTKAQLWVAVSASRCNTYPLRGTERQIWHFGLNDKTFIRSHHAALM
jgi:hypothetical protein